MTISTLSPFETTFRGVNVCSLADFLSPTDITSFASTSTACQKLVDEQLVIIFARFKQISEKPRPHTIHVDKINSLLHEAEASIPATDTVREIKVIRTFFARLAGEYPIANIFSIAREGLDNLLGYLISEESGNRALIQCFRHPIAVCGNPRNAEGTQEEIVAYLARLESDITGVQDEADRLGLRDIHDLMLAGNYQRVTDQDLLDLRDRLPPETRELIEQNPEQIMPMLRRLPRALFDRPNLQGEAWKEALQCFLMMSVMTGFLAIARILVNSPETTLAEVTAKVALLRTKMQDLLDFAVIYACGSGSLNFKGRGLQRLPPEIQLFKLFRGMDLSDNDFRAVPLLSDNCTSIDLSRNPRLKGFDNLAKLPHLERLYLSAVGLTRVPGEVLSRTNLNFLDLSNNPLDTLPAGFCALFPQMWQLNLSGTGIRRLPADLFTGSLRPNQSQRNVNLSNNRLVTLPAALAALLAESGTRVDITGNPLIFVPMDLLLGSASYFERGMNGMIDAFPFCQEHLSQPTSALGKLYKQFVKPEEEYNEEEIRIALQACSQEEQNLIFEMVWVESGNPVTEDAQWGEHHAFANLLTLALAVKSAINKKYERLPRAQWDKIWCGALVQVASGHRSMADILVPGSALADAMERAASDSFVGEIWPVSVREASALTERTLAGMPRRMQLVATFRPADQV